MPAAALSQKNQPLQLLSLALLLTATLMVFADSLISMVGIWWRAGTYNHGFLIPLISAWYLYQHKERVSRIPVEGSTVGLLPFAGALAIWLLGLSADLLVLEHLGTVVALQSLFVLIMGVRWCKAALFPIVYLIFMVPMGDQLTPWLQQVTAEISVRALQLSGIPVYVSGLFIEVPGGRFEVAQACSGIRYLVASLALGTLYAWLNYRSLSKRVVFLLASILVPILANGIRAYLIILIAYVSDMEYATGVDHLIYGWLFFGVVIMLLFWAGSFWRDPITTKLDTPDSGANTVTRRMSVPFQITLLACLPLSLLFVAKQNLATNNAAQAPLLPPLPAIHGATLTEASNDWYAQFTNPDQELRGRYAEEGRFADLHLIHYRQQQQNKELVNQTNRLFQKGWTLDQSPRQVKHPDIDFPVNEIRIRDINGRARLIWYSYWVNNRAMTNPLSIKLQQAWLRLSGRPIAGTAVLWSTMIEEELAIERERLARWVTALKFDGSHFHDKE